MELRIVFLYLLFAFCLFDFIMLVFMNLKKKIFKKTVVSYQLRILQKLSFQTSSLNKLGTKIIELFFRQVYRKNKPSFCSGSCGEIHARRKLQNKTSLKYFNFLETQLTLNTLETSLKNSLETPLNFF